MYINKKKEKEKAGNLPNLLKRRLKYITSTATFQIKTIRMEVFLTIQFRTIWKSGDKDKEIREIVYLIFVCFVGLSVPSTCQLEHF